MDTMGNLNEMGLILPLNKLVGVPAWLLQEWPSIIMLAAMLAFFVVSLSLLYHWIKYGKGNINRGLVSIVYFAGAVIFIASAAEAMSLLQS